MSDDPEMDAFMEAITHDPFRDLAARLAESERVRRQLAEALARMHRRHGTNFLGEHFEDCRACQAEAALDASDALEREA